MKKKPDASPGTAELHHSPQPPLRIALIVTVYLLAFILFDFITKQYEDLPGVVAWYPPAGFTYAFLLVFGVSFTPVVTIALLISSLFIYRMPQPPYLLFLWALVISLIYGAATVFLRKRIRFEWQLRKFRDVSWFVFTTVMVSALLAVLTVSSSTLSSALPRTEVFHAIFQWWVGETVGVLSITPFLLTYVMPWLKRFAEGQPLGIPSHQSFPWPKLVVIGQGLSLALTLYWVFGPRVFNEYQPLYLISLPLIWIALYHGFKGVTLGIMVSNFGVMLALLVFRSDLANLGELQLLMIINCIVGLLVGAVVTERIQADETFKKGEKRFQALVEHSLEEISLVDTDGTLTYESPTMRRPLGYPPNSFVGYNIIDLFHPDDRAAAAQLLEQVGKKSGSVKEASFRLRHQDGSWRWMEGSLINLLDDPAVRSVVINYRDVTVRKQGEEKIKMSNDELSMLFNLSHSLAEADTLEDIFNLVNRHAVESVHTTFARIALIEGENYIMRAAYPLRPLDHDLRIGERNPVTSLPYSQLILEKNTPMILRASDPEISVEEKKILLLDFAQSLCLIPLYINDFSQVTEKSMGLLMLGEVRKEGREPFTAEKMRLAQTIGDSAAIAIRRMLLREQTERHLQQLVALSKIDLAIISSSDMVFSLGVLLLQVLEQLKVDAADVWLFNPMSHKLEFVTSNGFLTPTFKKGKPLRLGEGFAGQAALERRIIYVPNLGAQDVHARLAKALAEESFISCFAVPLIVKEQVKGVMEIFHRSEFEPNEEWLKFLNALSNQAAIAIDNSSLFNDLLHSNIELTQAYDATIQGWSKALDLRDKETEGHTQRVTELTIKLGRLFGLSEEDLIHVRRGALLHDIGKMGVPDGILLKPGPLTDEESVKMRKHTTFAYELLYPIHYLRPAVDIPYCHHEKWDGKGYPRGLSGKQIPLAARIFAVIDVWDALTSDRPYRAAWPEEKVLAHIRSLVGTHFDPQVVNICLESGFLTGKTKKRKRMEKVRWSEKFSVGVKEFDRHHQQLIKLLNRLISATGATSTHSETISDILIEMTRYAQAHFKAEEKLMEAYGFPGLEEQKIQHRAFRKKTADFTAAAPVGVEQIPEALLKYLVDWLSHHILEEDMSYRSFFNDKGIK